ncbi:MAG: AAA family ATPase, partial [Muribaculaceae bacterium]|nr:AAA family ATPase [Muribaculaceae bacterium]
MNIKSLYIENFRNFGDEGTCINLSPITFFTGCNSAGKSSATKAFLLLDSYLSDIKANNYNLIETPLDFSKIVKLGNFDTVLNKTSKEIGVNNIVLGYSWASAILTEDIQVNFSFIQKTSDSLNNGWLNEMLILIGSIELLSIKIIDNH